MMGVSVLFALAVWQVLAKRQARQRLLCAAIAGALIFELAPVPRTVYSAEIPSIYRTIAADPRPVLVLELPFGVRDGLSSTGNFSAASQFYQTFHHKRLLGGYLSRVDRQGHAR
jgi:hypothetical protein